MEFKISKYNQILIIDIIKPVYLAMQLKIILKSSLGFKPCGTDL